MSNIEGGNFYRDACYSGLDNTEQELSGRSEHYPAMNNTLYQHTVVSLSTEPLELLHLTDLEPARNNDPTTQRESCQILRSFDWAGQTDQNVPLILRVD